MSARTRRSPRKTAPAARPVRPARAAVPPGWSLAAALAAALLLHVRALAAPFFADDLLFLDFVRSRSLLAALVSRDPLGNFFRPLGRAAWFWVLARGTGESAVAFHAANLALLLACVALVWVLARRLAGDRAAAVAAALVAVTHAADVPVRWASGSQDLLAVALVLAGTWAMLRERRWLAAVAFLAAPLAKEVVALAVLPAALLARRAGEPWRATVTRAWPAVAGTGAWLVLRALAFPSHAPGASPLTFSALAPLAALVAAGRTVLGLETSIATPFTALLAPLTLAGVLFAAAAVELASRAPAAGADRPDAPARRDVIAGAALWFVVGILPGVFVAPIWSAYFYLFALVGSSLLAGVLLSAAPPAAAVAVVVLLGATSRWSGGIEEFATAPGAFTAQSHVNDFYLARGMGLISRTSADLHRLYPHPAPRSTFFFTGVPSFAGVQSADGPFVRGVFRDSSLRSYFLTQLSAERAARGPSLFPFYSADSGHFRDETNDPQLYLRVALGEILSRHEDVARLALEMSLRQGHMSPTARFLAGLMALEAGDHAAAHTWFASGGIVEDAHGDAELDEAETRVAAGDTIGALMVLQEGVMRHVDDVRLHAFAADLQLTNEHMRRSAAFEAYAARVLAPDAGASWRRWAFALYWQARYPEARDALERYYAIAPEMAGDDPAAGALRQELPRMLPGGDLMQRAMQKEAAR